MLRVICVCVVGKATWTNARATWLFVPGDSNQEKASTEAYKMRTLPKKCPPVVWKMLLSVAFANLLRPLREPRSDGGNPPFVSQILWRWPRWLRGHSESSVCSSSICTRCGKSSFASMETGMRPRSYSSDPRGEEAFLRPARALLSVLWPRWKNVFVG